MTKTTKEAEKLWCPFASNNSFCMADKCMAWEWDDSDELDIKETHNFATTEEIVSGIFSNPIFKKSNTGWCKLIYKDY